MATKVQVVQSPFMQAEIISWGLFTSISLHRCEITVSEGGVSSFLWLQNGGANMHDEAKLGPSQGAL